MLDIERLVQIARRNDQDARVRKMFVAVVLTALDDAIVENKKNGGGERQIEHWARSRDGREILSLAGVDPNERFVKGLVEFVRRGIKTSTALRRSEAE